jgi:hypothetical protein
MLLTESPLKPTSRGYRNFEHGYLVVAVLNAIFKGIYG